MRVIRRSTGGKCSRLAKAGFTIVELLIVVVVVGILAAISIVAYNGIQNRTHDSSVQNDLSQTYKKIQLFKVDNTTNPVAAMDTHMNSIFVVNRQSYGGGGNVLIYCVSNNDFAIVGRSKSKTGFYYSSVSGSGELSTWPGDGNASLCPAAGISTTAPGYNHRWIFVNGAWETWFTVGA
jgi:prepilin-type N-terminal cleavage/methylation domain-containing protein